MDWIDLAYNWACMRFRLQSWPIKSSSLITSLLAMVENAGY